jgi:hypothetical protein
MKAGDSVYVDEGDSQGAREYTGTIDAINPDGTIRVQPSSGCIRVAQPHMVDPL